MKPTRLTEPPVARNTAELSFAAGGQRSEGTDPNAALSPQRSESGWTPEGRTLRACPPLPPPHWDPSSHNLRRVVYHLEQTTGEGGGRLGAVLPGAQGAGAGGNGDRLPQDAVPRAVTVRAHGVGAEARVAQRRLLEYNRGR